MGEDELRAALENPKHTHGKWVKRPWWKWTIHWDSEAKRPWIWRQDRIEIPCEAELIAVRPARIERERDAEGIKLVASRQFRCTAPPSYASAEVLLYAATRVPNGLPRPR